MYSYTTEEILHALRAAPRFNAGAKRFLKSEVKKGERGERFMKGLRNAMAAHGDERLIAFLDRSLPDFEFHLFVLGRYLFWDEVSAITEAIIEQYADNFNAT